MRVVFLGTPEFAVPSLESLVAAPDITVPLVVTQPDRPSGRGRKLTAPAVKVMADSLEIPTLQPNTLRDDAAVAEIARAKPDLLIVVAYGELLRRNILELTALGCLNVHPSLLPSYRGAAPIPAAILNGDTVTGVSIMKLVRKLDAGPVLVQQEVDVKADDTTASLSSTLARIAAEMLPSVVGAYAAGLIQPAEQDESRATYTREWTSADARIGWTRSAEEIERLIRAANPWPVAWTSCRGERLRVLSSTVANSVSVALPPGDAMVLDGRVAVGTGRGWLTLETVQSAGKRPMPALDWWRGLRMDRLTFDFDTSGAS